jgi:hypothetical protein
MTAATPPLGAVVWLIDGGKIPARRHEVFKEFSNFGQTFLKLRNVTSRLLGCYTVDTLYAMVFWPFPTGS